MKQIVTSTISIASLLSSLLFPSVETFAQATKRLDGNYLFYMTNTKDMVDATRMADAIRNLGFPFSGGKECGYIWQELTEEYTDAETGFSLPAGRFQAHRVSDDNNFYDSNTKGISNLRRIVLYMVGYGEVRPYVDGVYEDGELITGTHHFVNKEVTYGPVEGSVNGWSYYSQKRPFRIIYDFVEGGDELPSDLNTTQKSFIDNNYIATQDEYIFNVAHRHIDTNPEYTYDWEWTDTKSFTFSFKRGSYCAGVAFLCADSNAKTYFAKVGTTLTSSKWRELETTDIKDIDVERTKTPAYNLQGMRVNTNYKGIIIENGHKYFTPQ